MTQPIRIGVLRLVDSAPVILAEASGLFHDQGIDVQISIEPSWSNIADKLTYGVLDAAVMLPPLALAAAAGLRGPKARLVVPMSLSQGGNTIVANNEIAACLTDGRDAPQLRAWLQGQEVKPRFAVVHAFSTHNLLFRYWLASSGADPDRDIATVVIPPEGVVEALAQDRIAGFCAGAPWGDEAERRGAGQILLGTSSIWPFHPEKCLCVGEAWAESNPELLHHLLLSVLQAQARCDRLEDAAEIAAVLADPTGLGLPLEATKKALRGGLAVDSIRFHIGEAWFPARAHALWFLGQMRRWRWLANDVDLPALAAQVYRPDLLTSAVTAVGLYPAAGLPSLEGNAMLPMPDDDAFSPGAGRKR